MKGILDPVLTLVLSWGLDSGVVVPPTLAILIRVLNCTETRG